MDIKNYFDRVILINLKRRPDRLVRVTEALKQVFWPFLWPEIFPAIDGNLVPRPNGWRSGNGAWGCMRSHQQVLENAICDGKNSILVLEDDVCFADDFATKVESFLSRVPDDWDQLMFGGQHVNLNGMPKLVSPGIYRCTDCERTHCYAIRGAFMRKLYQRWLNGGRFMGEVHCDWIMGRDPDMQFKHNVYAPEQFVVGQERCKSDINGHSQPRKFWNPPPDNLPVVFLKTDRSTAAKLRWYGFHTGYSRNVATGLDEGLTKIFRESNGNESMRIRRLSGWIQEVQWEAASDPHLICTVWFPEATLELVKSASKWPVREVVAESLEEALLNLPEQLKRPFRASIANRFVVHLKASKQVVDELRSYGWHNGYWRDNESGIDKGLLELYKNTTDVNQRIKGLTTIIGVLQKEADVIHNGVAVIWHPEIDENMVKMSTNVQVISLAANCVREALDIWQEAKDNLQPDLAE